MSEPPLHWPMALRKARSMRCCEAARDMDCRAALEEPWHAWLNPCAMLRHWPDARSAASSFFCSSRFCSDVSDWLPSMAWRACSMESA